MSSGAISKAKVILNYETINNKHEISFPTFAWNCTNTTKQIGKHSVTAKPEALIPNAREG